MFAWLLHHQQTHILKNVLAIQSTRWDTFAYTKKPLWMYALNVFHPCWPWQSTQGVFWDTRGHLRFPVHAFNGKRKGPNYSLVTVEYVTFHGSSNDVSRWIHAEVCICDFNNRSQLFADIDICDNFHGHSWPDLLHVQFFFQNGWIMWYPLGVCLHATNKRSVTLAICDEHSLKQKWRFKRYTEKFRNIVESIQQSASKEHPLNQTVFSRVFGVVKARTDELYRQKLADVIDKNLKSTNQSLDLITQKISHAHTRVH